MCHNCKKYLYIVLFFFCAQAKAQRYIMSSVPFQYKNPTHCLDVQTGIAVFNGNRNKGDFSLGCVIQEQFNLLGVILYPNPVKNLAKIKFSVAPPVNSIFQISAWTPQGQKIDFKKAYGSAIYQGIQIDFSILSSGTYFLVLRSEQHLDAVKFVKVD